MYWFYFDDLNCGVGGTTQKYAVAKPSIPTIWPI
jgi:hypothetical protein